VVLDFFIFLVGALVFDRVGFSQLRRTAGMFHPVSGAFAYKSTIFPRLLLLPPAALLSAYSKHHEKGATIAAIAGLLLILLAFAPPWVRAIRERLSNLRE
jgi:hypothetical protein